MNIAFNYRTNSILYFKIQKNTSFALIKLSMKFKVFVVLFDLEVCFSNIKLVLGIILVFAIVDLGSALSYDVQV